MRNTINIQEYNMIINNKNVEIIVETKRCKYLRLKVKNNKTIIITTYFKLSFDKVKEIITKNENKIIKYLENPSFELKEDEICLFGEIIKNDYQPKELKKIYEDSIIKIEKLFNEIQIKNNFPKVNLYFRKMKSRWGVCYPSIKKIGLSTYLIYTPLQLIEYVIYHEYCHLKYPNHSKNFYNELSKYCSNYKELRKELKKYSSLL